jgi:hypothetical protein
MKIKDISFYAYTDHSKLPEFQILPNSTTYSSLIKNIDLIPKAYATVECYEWHNDLVISSFSMSFDKNVLFDSEIIEPGTDIFKLESIKNYILTERYEWISLDYSIKFSAEIEDRLAFEAGEGYTVYFSCETTDGLRFNKSTTMIIRQE